MRYPIFRILCFFLVMSCTKDASTPEGLLRQISIDMTQKKLDKSYFEKYTTGKMLENIEQLNEEELKKYSNLSHVKNPEISISNKSCTSEKCSLTYIVKYDVHMKEKKDFQSEVKKIATIVKVDGKWKVSDVVNLKTFYEAVNPINALED